MEKLARRDIFPFEVEEVFAERPAWKKDKKNAGPDRYLMIGKTGAGRALTIVVLCMNATRKLRAITGWPSSPAEKSYFGRNKP